MERMTFKTLFYIMKTRLSRNGEDPVLLRVTINGLRAGTTTNLKVNPDLWHSALGKSLGTDPQNEEINNTLDVIKVKVMKIYREMEIDGVEITAQKIIDKYLGKDEILFELLKESDTKRNEQLEKLRKNIIGHHQYVKEQIAIQQKNTNARLERIENLLREQQEKQGILKRLEQWIRSI